MRVLVCGSRNISDALWVGKQIDIFLEEHPLIAMDDLVIIEGGARGVDSIAKYWAKFNKIPFEEYPADWDTFGKKAGFIRNEIMVKDCDCCLILWDGISHGTKNDIDLCEKYKKEHKVVLYGKNEQV